MKIAILEPIGIKPEKLLEIKAIFTDLNHELVFFSDRKEDEKTLISRAKDAEAIIVSNIPLSSNFIEACPKLKMISVAFTGVDHIDMQACKNKNILVSNAAGFSNQAVSELALGLIFALQRKIIEGNELTRMEGSRGTFLGSELAGKTVGIIGAGAIGLCFAKMCMNFGCKILAYSRTNKDIEGIKFVSKKELLEKSDIISLHVPLNKETNNIIDEEELKLMKKTALLINTARGAVINMKALSDALKLKTIAAAAVDVYEKEPPLPKDHVLLDAPNLICLPHVAFATNESFDRRIEIVIENIVLWLKDKPRNIME